MTPKYALVTSRVHQLKRKRDVFEFFCAETENDEQPYLSFIGATRNWPGDTRGLFEAIEEAFFADYPSPLQSTAMEERVAAVNLAGLTTGANLDCAALEIEGDTLSVACAGNFTALLFRDGEMTRLSSGQNSRENKIFNDFIAGHIEAGDKIVAITKNIFDFISPDRLGALVFQSTHGQIATRIANLVKNVIPEDEPVTGVVIEVLEHPEQADVKAAHHLKSGLFSFLTNWNLYDSIKTLKISRPSLPKFSFRAADNRLNKSARFKIFLALGAALLLITAIVATTNIQAQKKARQHAETFAQLDAIDQKLTAAQAAWIYKDAKTAKSLLTQAETMLSESYRDQDTDLEYTQRWTQLHSKWQDLWSEVSNAK